MGIVSASVLAALALPAALAAPTFTLVRDGKPAATIVIAAKPAPAAQFAAYELQYHVRKISGATLPIVTDALEVSGPRILVGESKATRALRLRSRDFASQEYAIRFLPGPVPARGTPGSQGSEPILVLMGRETRGREAFGPAMPDRAEGRFGIALEFDGKQNVFTVADCGFSDEAGTMEAWVWMPAEKQENCHGTILRLDGADPWTYHIIQRDMGTSCISYTTYDGTNGHGLRSGELTEGWHFVRGTHDLQAGTMELFVDGQSCGKTAFTRTTCKGAVMGIGGMAPSGSTLGNPFRGRIDEVRISKVVRSDDAASPFTPDEHTTCLFHFDEAEGLPVDSAGAEVVANPPPLFGENGTLYAVYDFLERYCDVRWYAPGELGLVCPERKTLTVQAKDLQRHPAMIHRWITPTPLYLPGPPEQVRARDVETWKLRMRIGGQAFWVCHSFYGYYDRFLKDHPDWFAQGYQGQPPQMCYTNPEFIAQVVQDARDYFDGKGKQPGATAEGDVFGLVPMDNMSWCKCPRCQAELNQAEMQNQQFNNGKASDYVFGFVNKVAREVRKTHPDKWIGALAYSDYAYYPTKEKPEPNVVVQMCLHTRNWWCPSMEVNDRKVLHDWRAADPERPLYLWLYYCFPALNAKYGPYHYFPGYFAHTIVPQMKLYHDANITGIFMEHSSECGESYLMDQLEFYVTLKLADDPTLNGNALIEEFFARYYGAAARPMRALYLAIEQTFSDPRNYPVEIQRSPAHQHQNETLAWGSLGTPERMAQLARLMAEAKAAARTDMERARVAAFEKGQWEYMLAGRAEYEKRTAARAAAPPKVDVPRVPDTGGDPAQVDWSAAADLGGWGGLYGDPTDRKLSTRVAHDGAFLYVQLQERLDPKTLKPGPSIWDGDDFELFFARERSSAYHQIAVGPDGKWQALAWKLTDSTWNSGAVVASDTSAPDVWTVRLALPLARIVPGGVKPGESLFANFYRASPGATNLLAWTPTFAGGFHDTSRLGELSLR